VAAEHQGNIPLPAASLTKLATTLAALETWPLDHSFDTLVGMRGTLKGGVLEGDLIIRGGGDPLFVWEEAIVLANHLRDLGIQRVTGDLLVSGMFTMNFEEDPAASLAALQQAMTASSWPWPARQAYANLPVGTPQPNLQIAGTARWVPAGEFGPGEVQWLVRHRSLPLVAILKAMNIYSNNPMSNLVADRVGGPAQVMAKAIRAADLPAGQLSLSNGSGLGLDNQMSARVAVAITAAMHRILSAEGFSVADVLPVVGEDVGTLIDRQLPLTAAVKTGSLAEVSSLAGMVPTRERGPVWFAIINRGWELPELRAQQDELLRAIQAHWGVAYAPKELRTKVTIQTDPFRFGDPSRNQATQAALE
jgi:serine-type D-Ala-D-Ala carboxypeptidase/endopeptidase (penicillin-binding protein 4)